MHRYLAGALALVLASPAYAQSVQSADATDTEQDDNPSSEIVVTAARSQLPASALPLTVDVIDSEALERQVLVSGSTVDAVSALLPSFSPILA